MLCMNIMNRYAMMIREIYLGFQSCFQLVYSSGAVKWYLLHRVCDVGHRFSLHEYFNQGNKDHVQYAIFI